MSRLCWEDEKHKRCESCSWGWVFGTKQVTNIWISMDKEKNYHAKHSGEKEEACKLRNEERRKKIVREVNFLVVGSSRLGNAA